MDGRESGQMVSEKSEMIINLMYIYHKHCEIMEKFSTPKPKPLFGKTQKLVAAGFPKDEGLFGYFDKVIQFLKRKHP